MKELPKSIETEIEILGLILKKQKTIIECVNELKTEDFSDKKHELIYRNMCTLFAEGTDITIITLVDKIGKDELKKIGGISYLADIETKAGFYQNAKALIKILKEKGLKRRTLKALYRASELLYQDEKEANEVIGKLQNALVEKSSKNGIVDDAELLATTLTEIEKRYANGGDIPGMRTGFDLFDKATNGLRAGDLMIIGGRPSMGKTLIALNMADGLAKNGYKVGIIEMEMIEEKLGMRRLAYTALIEVQKLQTGRLTEDEFVNLGKAYNTLVKRNNVLTDCSDYQNILTIKAKAKAMKQMKGLDVLIIDHLALMEIKDNGNRAQAIGEVTRQLKLLAKELDITVILLCQLNRAVEARADKRPMLSDLKESGSIEQDADVVMFAYRDSYYNQDTEEQDIIEWIIAKQRDGKVGTLKFAYKDKYQLILNLDFER